MTRLTKQSPRSVRTAPRRGPRARQPQKAFINVLVRTSTRTALHRLKATIGLPSQGEVIDYLVARLRNSEVSG